MCGETFFLKPAFSLAFEIIDWTALTVRVPVRPKNNGSLGFRFFICNSNFGFNFFDIKKNLSFDPFPLLTHPIPASNSKSPDFIFTASLTLKPEEYRNSIISLCFLFSAESINFVTSSLLKTTGIFFGICIPSGRSTVFLSTSLNKKRIDALARAILLIETLCEFSSSTKCARKALASSDVTSSGVLLMNVKNFSR